MTLERISRRFLERHPGDAVRLVEQLADEDKSTLIQSLEPGTAAGILQAMTPADAVSCIALMTPAQSIPVLKYLSPNYAAGCMRRLAADQRREILAQAGRDNDLKSVRIIFARWVSTVRGLIVSSEAISWLVNPSADNWSTSRSRVVRASYGSVS